MFGIKSYNQFMIYTNALENDRSDFRNWSQAAQAQGLDREKVKLDDKTALNIRDSMINTRIIEGNLNTFLGKHWFLGRIFQVVTGRWKDTTKTEKEIDNLFQNLPQDMRAYLDPQRAKLSWPSQKKEKELNNLLAQIESNPHLKTDEGQELIKAILVTIKAKKSTNEKLIAAQNAVQNLPDIIIRPLSDRNGEYSYEYNAIADAVILDVYEFSRSIFNRRW